MNEQLIELLKEIFPEELLCFDDEEWRRAAHRIIEHLDES